MDKVRIKTCVHFNFFFTRVWNFKNEKNVILEQKLDDEASCSYLSKLCIDNLAKKTHDTMSNAYASAVGGALRSLTLPAIIFCALHSKAVQSNLILGA